MTFPRKNLLIECALAGAFLVMCGCGVQGMPIPPDRVSPETAPDQPAAGTSQKGSGTSLSGPGSEVEKKGAPPSSPEENQEEPPGGFPDEGRGQ